VFSHSSTESGLAGKYIFQWAANVGVLSEYAENESETLISRQVENVMVAFTVAYLRHQACHGPSALTKQVRKVLWTRKGVRATVVTTGHCTHAQLTSG